MADLRNALHGTSHDDSAAVVVHDGVLTTYASADGQVRSAALPADGVTWSTAPQAATPDQAHKAAAEWLAGRRGGGSGD